METVLSVLLLTILSGLTAGLVREHFFVNNQMFWSDAQQYCRDHYGDLSTIASQEENLKIKMSAGENDFIWIGLNKMSNPQSLQWSDGSNSVYRQWANGQPQMGSSNENSVDMHVSSGDWHDRPCGATLSFSCHEIMPELLVVQENKTWEEALEHCRDHHTDLASLTSEEQLLVAEQKSGDAQTPNVWTGLRFLAGEWLWLNGKPLQSRVFPEGALPQCPANPFHCGARNSEVGRWEIRDCEERLNFICG